MRRSSRSGAAELARAHLVRVRQAILEYRAARSPRSAATGGRHHAGRHRLPRARHRAGLVVLASAQRVADAPGGCARPQRRHPVVRGDAGRSDPGGAENRARRTPDHHPARRRAGLSRIRARRVAVDARFVTRHRRLRARAAARSSAGDSSPTFPGSSSWRSCSSSSACCSGSFGCSSRRSAAAR